MLNFWAICLFFLQKRIVMQYVSYLDEILAASRYGGQKPVDGVIGSQPIPKAYLSAIYSWQYAFIISTIRRVK